MSAESEAIVLLRSDEQAEAADDSRASETREARSPSTDLNRSSRYVWYVVFLLTVVNVVNYMDRVALSVLMPLIKADLQLSDAQLGLLIGFAFSLFYAICRIPIARWADRGIRRNIIAITLATWSLLPLMVVALYAAANGLPSDVRAADAQL